MAKLPAGIFPPAESRDGWEDMQLAVPFGTFRASGLGHLLAEECSYLRRMKTNKLCEARTHQKGAAQPVWRSAATTTS